MDTVQDLRQVLIKKALSLSANPTELDQELESIETDPLINIFPDRLRVIQLLAKVAISDFFGLRMLLKRTKFNQLVDFEKFMKFFNEVEVRERESNYQQLFNLLIEARSLFADLETLYSRVIVNTEKHVLRRLSQYYTCFDLNELATLLHKGVNETRELVLLDGYNLQDNWVRFNELSKRLTTSDERELLIKKQMELTELTNILSNFK